MNKITMLPTGDEGSEPRRRLHLRDITNEVPVEAESVGADLRAARLRRGEDIRGIAQSLRIRRDQLEALEESRYDALPARAYAVGFVRSYAEYLGLDSRHIVDRYKAELDRREAETADIRFPDGPREERRLPRGTALIVALVVASGAYGGWLLTKSTDDMVATRVAENAPQTGANEPAAAIPPSLRAGRGDIASAATPREGMVPAVRGPVTAGAAVQPGAIYEPSPLAAQEGETGEAWGAGASDAPEMAAELPPLPEGTPYGAENVDGRVVVRARRDGAWIRVEDGEGRVLIEQTLKAGDSYRAPRVPGVILVARDASAFELMVDGTSLGLAGPPTLVLTGKSLDPDTLLAAAPRQTQPEDAAEALLEPSEPAQTTVR
ncbi:helix-turn-helix domain-containing protein [Parvibaculum sp.]|uniref:helix-turn-helix domain-containing protein n=1 Tax=Parvibaculum sp. TaxID=2024848 RepID=UPI00348D35D8